MVYMSIKKLSPAYLEFKHMVLLINSLKDETGLWSSKYSGDTIDLFVSSVVIWFTYEAYRSLGLVNEIKISLEMLEKTIIVVANSKDMSLTKLLEILQCSATILKYGNPSRELINTLKRVFLNRQEQLISLVRSFNPYIDYLPSLIVINIANMAKLSNSELGSLLRNTVKEYLRALKERENRDATPLALYWVLEALLELMNLKEKGLCREDEIIAISKRIESLIVNSLSELMNSLEDMPLDIVLWYYHTLESFMKLEGMLKMRMDEPIGRYYSSIVRYILKVGLIKWKETAYAKILRDIRETLLDSQNITLGKDQERSIDLITLSLLIGAYERIGSYVVTYITKHDLKQLKNVENAALILGIAFLILGGHTLTISILQILQRSSIQYTYVFLTACFIAFGSWILYLLIRQGMKSWRDLINIVVLFIRTIVKKLIKP